MTTTDILLDFQATVNNPSFEWNKGPSRHFMLNGYKYDLVATISPLGSLESFQVLDSDGDVIKFDKSSQMCIVDWIMVNAVPHYIQFPN